MIRRTGQAKRSPGARHAPDSAAAGRDAAFALYEACVQSPASDVAFISRIYRRQNGRDARALREDFAGSAALSRAWIASDRSGRRRATAIDLDQGALAYAKKAGLRELGQEGAARISFLRQDVRRVVRGSFDVAVAYNFSYFVFKERRALVAYARAVHRSLRLGGLLFLDLFGGVTAQSPSLETRAGKDGVTYIWEQAAFDPLSSHLEAYIHFRRKDGTLIRRAFRYDWRLWQPVEILEILEEAGFQKCDVYWEDRDQDGARTGRFRRRVQADSEPSWTAYIVATAWAIA